jgi:U4/U6.U5 tri-snRNP-associated protein 2
LFLALDLPAAPLFQDLNEKKIIPQVPLSTILAKFDGESTQEIGPTLKRHHLTRLPPYLILHIKRFTKNNFVEEKNPTIVNYPMAIDLKDCEYLHGISMREVDLALCRCRSKTVLAATNHV